MPERVPDDESDMTRFIGMMGGDQLGQQPAPGAGQTAYGFAQQPEQIPERPDGRQSYGVRRWVVGVTVAALAVGATAAGVSIGLAVRHSEAGSSSHDITDGGASAAPDLTGPIVLSTTAASGPQSSELSSSAVVTTAVSPASSGLAPSTLSPEVTTSVPPKPTTSVVPSSTPARTSRPAPVVLPDAPPVVIYPAPSTSSVSAQPTPTSALSATPTSSATALSTRTSAPSASAAAPALSPQKEKFEIAQDMCVGFDASMAPSAVEHVVAQTHIGCVYFTGSKDIAGQGFNAKFFAELGKAAGAPMIGASDEEGGLVKRENYPFDFPSAETMGKMTAAQVTQIGEEVGKQMRADGLSVDLAPVLGLYNPNDPGGAISPYQRSFGSNPANVTEKAGAFAKGLEAEGITPTFKHFPGISFGKPNSNTDGYKVTLPPRSQLEANDMVPYKNLLPQDKTAWVMMGNGYIPGLGPNVPASINPAAYKLLMGLDPGTKRIVVTDDLGSITKYDGKSLPENIADAVKAGATIPLCGYTSVPEIEQAVSDVAAAVPASQIQASYEAVQAVRSAE